LGGVEVHARSLDRELRRLGVESAISSDPSDLSGDWDVIQTHGGGIASIPGRALRVHTLHGTTTGRMAACGEWLWARGYLAAAREIRGALSADVVLAVHPALSYAHLARRLGRPVVVCGNGWDSSEGETPAPLSGEWLSRIDPSKPLWIYVGRGDDLVKGADRVKGALRADPSLQLAAAPGAGFEDLASVIRTGRLSNSEIRSLMDRADGMVVPSRYEGQSLAVLEALAAGVRLLATPVGGVRWFPGAIEGLHLLEDVSAPAMAKRMAELARVKDSAESRAARARRNRELLPRWSQVAKSALDAVEERLRKKREAR
jgi:glycosyltransferase involved in cell wall biosynthesis